MPLPTIATPTYSLVLPSTKKEVKYRPFIVKEEKLLVLALEGEDQKDITTAIKSVLQSCIKTRGVKVEELPTFDIEYLFLNIRGKSVGEEVEVNIIAPDDNETSVKVEISLDEIEVKEYDGHDKKIKLDDDQQLILFKFKYFSSRFLDIIVTIFITDSLISIFANRNVFLFPIRKFSFLLLNNFLFTRKLVLNQMTKSLIYSSIK